MRLHISNSHVQVVAAGLLWTLSYGSCEVKELIGSAGVIESILAACKEHVFDVAVQEACSGALKNLTVLPENARRVVLLGGIDSIVEAMQVHVGFASVQEQACSVVRNISLAITLEPQRAALPPGEGAKVSRMRTPSTPHARMLHAAGEERRNEEREVAKMLAQRAMLTAVPHVVSSLREHAGHRNIVEQACSALHNISCENQAVHAYMSRMHGDACGVRALVCAVQRYPEDVRILEAGLGALSNLTAEDAVCNKLISSDNLRLLLHVLCRDPRAPQVDAAVCAVLANLACCNSSVSKELVKLGAMPVLLEALERNRQGASVVAYCLGAMVNMMLASTQASRAFAVSQEAPAALEDVLAVHPLHPSIQENGKQVLALGAEAKKRSESLACLALTCWSPKM